VEEDEDEDEAESSGEDIEGDDDDDMAPVDPAFRQRVVDALKSAGMAVEEDAEGDEDDDDEDADSEVWDDEQMMKVDEQLAQVFKQQAGRTRRVDLKREWGDLGSGSKSRKDTRADTE
jgi:DNA polymerase phi